MQNTPDISLIIPLLNEEESLLPLHNWILNVFYKDSRNYEVIIIDDGSTDDSWDVICTLTQKHLNVFGIRFVKNYGKSQALHAGFGIAKGNTRLATCPPNLCPFCAWWRLRQCHAIPACPNEEPKRHNRS